MSADGAPISTPGGPAGATAPAAGAAGAEAPRSVPPPRARSNAWVPYFFVAPFVLLFAVFMVYPLVYSLLLVTQQTSGPSDRVSVGLDNFVWLWSDPEFWTAVSNTLVFSGASVLIQIPAALALALLLNRPDIRGRSIFRLIFFAPILVGLAFVAVLFSLIFEKNTGLINVSLHGITSALPWVGAWDLEFPWLQNHGLLALIIAAFWLSLGYNMVYFLAALQNVNKDLLEAAEIDGAGPGARFLHVILPAIRPIGSFVLLLSIIGSIQLFELPYLLLDPGGGQEAQGLTVVMYLYNKGFDIGDLGMSSTVGWVIAAFLLAMAALQKAFGEAEGRR